MAWAAFRQTRWGVIVMLFVSDMDVSAGLRWPNCQDEPTFCPLLSDAAGGECELNHPRSTLPSVLALSRSHEVAPPPASLVGRHGRCVDLQIALLRNPVPQDFEPERRT